VRGALGVSRIITVDQVHGTDVLVVDEGLVADWQPGSELGTAGGGVPLQVADAMVTDQRDTALCIRVADCLPVLFADPRSGVIGAGHAGRVGLADGVLPATVEAMRNLGAREITAWQGPHICGSCYEVPDQMRGEVAALLPGSYAETSWGTPALDLGEAAARQLIGLGCQVERYSPCTRTSPDLLSHRRDGVDAGRLGALVWLPGA
jgi:YfiH family protein